MANPVKQIRFLDLSGEIISEPAHAQTHGTWYICEVGTNPYCRFKIKLSSKVSSSWRRIFKEKCEEAFPEKEPPKPGMDDIAIPSSEDRDVSDWEWQTYLDEKAKDIIIVESSLDDVEAVINKIKAVVDETQAVAPALELLVQKRIKQLKRKLK